MDEAAIRQIVGENKLTWDKLYECEASAAVGSVMMRCSQRTALKSLKAAARRAEINVARADQAAQIARKEIGARADRTNWPKDFAEMAERIDREGVSRVGTAERRRLLRGLPRAIEVAG